MDDYLVCDTDKEFYEKILESKAVIIQVAAGAEYAQGLVEFKVRVVRITNSYIITEIYNTSENYVFFKNSIVSIRMP
jgi:hypothetical protein